MNNRDRYGERKTVTVMFVEDEEILAETYADFLKDRYDVRIANSGDEALELVDNVDIVFLDRRMPGMSGDEVLTQILNRDIDCKIAMLSSIEPNIESSMGYDEYLTKPVSRETLLDIVSEFERDIQRSNS